MLFPRHASSIALALVFLASVTQAASNQHADEVVQLIHAQSLSSLKNDGIVAVQRLGKGGLPIHRHPQQQQQQQQQEEEDETQASMASASAQKPSATFAPFMIVPMPGAATGFRGRNDISGKEEGNSKLVAVDENGQMKDVVIPATSAHAPLATGHPLAMGGKHIVGMEDDGLVRTMDVPMTNAPASTPV